MGFIPFVSWPATRRTGLPNVGFLTPKDLPVSNTRTSFFTDLKSLKFCASYLRNSSQIFILFPVPRSELFHEPPLSPRSILDVCAEDVHRVLKRVSSIDKDDEWQQKGEALRRSGSLYLCALHVLLLLWWPPSKFVANCWHLWSPDCKIKGKHHYIITNSYKQIFYISI